MGPGATALMRTLFRQLQREGAGHVDDGPLGDAIGRKVPAADVSEDGGQVHNASPAPPQHLRENLLGQEKVTGDVDLQTPPEFFRRHLRKGFVHAVDHIVDQDVDPAEGLDRSLNGLVHDREVGGVA